MARTHVSLVLVIALGALAAAGCGKEETPSQAASRDAAAPLFLDARDVAHAARADLASGVPVSGTLKPSVDVRIASPVPEVLDEVLVKEGQRVARGQVLARFRTRALVPAEAGAEAQRKVAESDLQRMKNLLQEGAVSERDLESAEATFRQADAAWALARKRLDEAAVRSPIDGVIAQRWRQSGDRVADGDPIFRVVDDRALEFEATAPAQFAGQVKPGAAVLLTVSGGGQQREGRVARINPTADAATRQVKLYIEVPNRDGSLVGDLFASGRVVLATAAHALAVPRAALRKDVDGSTYVWVLAGTRLERRAVTAGLVDEAADRVEIRQGLRDGDSVVTAPPEGLAAGRAVQVQGD